MGTPNLRATSLAALDGEVPPASNSSIAAVDKLKERGATNIRFLCLLAAPEGIKRFTEAHPDVDVFTASIDERLDEKGYIVPGLGDAGDRMYGTK